MISTIYYNTLITRENVKWNVKKTLAITETAKQRHLLAVFDMSKRNIL